ncbi:MAG: 16S rRNA (cytidine(1402)-2'-O)-methyltransferase [Oscillatoriaceae bacterium SKW80]|nr:16S rRNA (cytidine(1402)-2'-O)-methyltransferase [Oscillatoriaceae bacterium SKYG93]MCX8121081.1 16S rRNA (cytidine(1402)-2'-O)-methyltransferase [Oscillatoriaceae bacterium SKW80]MDW8453589.1 16S rRNA (cytidine(1402)-2'-O)-methyltransferase [Oscillatoriaceae cyanobacterium SKYGB_i_bin93]HIK26940.1 16S rRNA (cytidine(1402)-2'-O)-methyltransferase [Oscillatoriaceae cyanobacterium M7585_C2015_266]
MQTLQKSGTLYIVGTPIGNLEDISFRAVRILKQVDAIAAEDTRHTGKLLHHFQIKKPQISYHEHNQLQRIPEILERLHQGATIALVTDAGMPGISDPGYELVKACVKNGITVVPIPGASAAITALSAAGLPTERFVFEGFLPVKGKERHQRLEMLQSESRTIILYEAPHRLRATLQDLINIFGGERQIVIARELTKLHEEFWRGTIEKALDYYSQREPQGEFTLIISGSPKIETPILSEESIKSELIKLLKQGMSRSDASRKIAEQTSLPRRQIYQLSLTINNQNL